MSRIPTYAAVFALSTGTAFAQEAAWPDLGSPAPGSAGDGSRDAALVVAIEDYAFAQDVPGAVANGQAWTRWLRDARGVPTVKTLVNNQATREEILASAEGVARRVQPGGRLWVVFVGHGAPARRLDDGVLVGVDAQQTAMSLEARSVARRDLLSRLETGPQAETVLVLDACFSGKTSGGDLAPGLAPLKAVSAPVSDRATILTAARGDEYAGPLNDGSRPAFSYLVLGAMRGWGDKDRDGTVTAREAVAYAEDALFQTVVGRSQTPTFDGPDLDLAQSAGQKSPDLGDLGGLQAPGTRGAGAVTVTTTGGGGLSSADIQALIEAKRQREALEARERDIRQRLERERATALEEGTRQKQAEASALWAQMRPLVDAGGPEAKRALEGFVKDWERAEVVVEDIDGVHRQDVVVPELEQARQTLAEFGASKPGPLPETPRASTSSAPRRRSGTAASTTRFEPEARDARFHLGAALAYQPTEHAHNFLGELSARYSFGPKWGLEGSASWTPDVGSFGVSRSAADDIPSDEGEGSFTGPTQEPIDRVRWVISPVRVRLTPFSLGGIALSASLGPALLAVSHDYAALDATGLFFFNPGATTAELAADVAWSAELPLGPLRLATSVSTPLYVADERDYGETLENGDPVPLGRALYAPVFLALGVSVPIGR